MQADFIGQPGSRNFVLLHRPHGASVPGLLVVPPFAEEMNKSRRMVRLLADTLLERGWALAIVDLFGTGDSDGEFTEASWTRWQQDVIAAADWCARQGVTVKTLLGIRLGSVLAAAAAPALPDPPRGLVFWQPVLDSRRFLNQFLRLRVAASLTGNGTRETVPGLRQALAGGQAIEVAGYTVTPGLAAQIDAVGRPTLAASTLVHWFELVREASASMPPAAARDIELLKAGGARIVSDVAAGMPFWSSSEIVVVPELVARTADALCGSQ